MSTVNGHSGASSLSVFRIERCMLRRDSKCVIYIIVRSIGGTGFVRFFVESPLIL